MPANVYFCTNCGEPQPEIGRFCTRCGAPIDPAVAKAGGPPNATIRLPQPSSPQAIPPTIALPDSTAPAPVSGRPPMTTVPMPPPPAMPLPIPGSPPAPTAPGAARRLSVRMIAIGAVMVIAVLAIAGVVASGALSGVLPRLGGRPMVDRMVVRADGGDTTRLVLMRSDGSNQVTLVDQPIDLRNNSRGDTYLFLDYVESDNDISKVRYYPYSETMAGAAILPDRQRIVFWYPNADGIEVRASDLEGANQVVLAQVVRKGIMSIPEKSDRILIKDQIDDNEARLRLVDWQGKATTLVENVPAINGIISPDGQSIAYWVTTKDRRVTLSVTDGSNTGTVIARDLLEVRVNFSSDSSRMFITRKTEDGTSFITTDAAGQNIVVLSRNSGGIGQVVQKRLVYQITRNDESSLFTSDLNGDDRIELVRAADNIAWAFNPARDRIIVSQKRGDHYSLQISDLRHEQVQELKRTDDTIDSVLLENGRLLMLRRQSNTSDTTLSTMKLDGSDEVVLKQGKAVYLQAERGDMVVVSGNENDQPVLYALNGEKATPLNDEAIDYKTVRITPDGRVVYTAEFRSGPAIYIASQDGKQRKLVMEGYSIVVTGF